MPGTGTPVVVGSAALQIVVDSSQLASQIQSQVGGAFKSAMNDATTTTSKAMGDIAGQVKDTAAKSSTAFTGIGTAGKQSFETVAHAARLAGGEFGPIERGVSLVTQASDGLKKKWDELPSSAAKIGAAMTATGAAVTAVGALAIGLGKKQEESHIALENAIKNTGHSYEDYAGQINRVIATEQVHGKSTADSQAALERLTIAFKDPAKAAQEMGAVDEWAAARHITLAQAAQQVIQAHNGIGRAFKSYGITVVNTVQAEKAATTATDAHQKAVDELAALQDKQAQQAQLAGAKSVGASSSAASAAKAHRDAVANLATAQAEFNKLVAGPTAGEIVKSNLDQAKAVRTYQDAIDNAKDAQQALADLAAGPSADQIEASYLSLAKAAKSTSDAQQKVLDAQAAVDALTKGPTGDTQAQAEEAVGKARLNVQKATNAQADAEAKLAAMKAAGTATDRQLQDQEIAVQEAKYGVHDANRALTTSEAALQKLHDDSLPTSAAMKTATDNLADAQLSLRESVDRQNAAQQKQSDMYAASVPGSAQYEAAQKKVTDTTIAVQEAALGVTDAAKKQADMYANALPGSAAYEAAAKKVADAQDALVASEKSATSGIAAGLSAGFAAENLDKKIADAKAKVAETAAKQAEATKKLTDATGKNSLEQQINTKFHDLAQRQAATFTGRLEALKTKVLDAAGAFGVKLGPELVKAGPLIMGLGAILETGLIQKFASLAVGVAWTVKEVAADLVGMAADVTATAATWVAENTAMAVSATAAFVAENAATLGIGLAIAGLVAAIVWVATHWSETWDWIKSAVSDAWDWIKHHAELIVGIAAPFLLPFVELVKHWKAIWGAVSGAFSDAWDAIKGVASGIGDFFSGIWNGIVKAIKFGINTEIQLFDDFISGANKLINAGLSIVSKIPGVGSLLPSHVDLPVIPKLAGGGTALEAGLAWVGEKGPELMRMPRGASVIPLPAAGGSTATTTGTTITVAEGAVQVTVTGSADAATVQGFRDAGQELAGKLADAIRTRGGV